MERHAKFIVVAVFIVLSLTGLVLFKTWISSTGASAQATKHQILFRGAVSGLSVGSDVRYLGVAIGKVTHINISQQYPGHVEVDFASEQHIPHKNLSAQLEPQGITGLSIVNLSLEPENSLDLNSKNGFIPGHPSIISQLTGPASNIAESASQVVNKANYLLNPENLESLSNSIKQLDHITTNLATATDNIGELMSNLNQASITLNSTLKTYRSAGNKIDEQLLPALQNAASELSVTATTAKSLLTDNAQSIDRLFNQEIPTLMGISDELAQSLKGINDLSNDLDNNPTQLIFGDHLPEMEVNLGP